MTRDEIYDHLAQVYLGKRNQIDEKRSKHVGAWQVINILITVVIFASSIYGLTAFLAQRSETLQNRIIFALSNGPIRINYDLGYPYPPVKTFSIAVPPVNADKYRSLRFSARGLEEGHPGVMRIELRNGKNEHASVFVDGVDLDWQEFRIPLTDFEEISDWTNLKEVSFVLESWNTEKDKGIVLIEDVCFSS